MVFLVLEAHRALHLGRGINESTQRISGQRVIVPASVDVFEAVGFMEAPFGVSPLEQKSFDLVGRIECKTVAFVLLVGKLFEHASDVGGISRPALVDHVSKHQDLAGPKYVGRSPVKRAPVYAQAEIAFTLGGEAAYGGTIECQVVKTLQQKLLVVIEHV